MGTINIKDLVKLIFFMHRLDVRYCSNGLFISVSNCLF